MKADGRCPRCYKQVRTAIRDEDGTRLLIDPTANRSGRLWVVDYQDGVPIMRMAGSGNDVPRREPLRYTRHICER